MTPEPTSTAPRATGSSDEASQAATNDRMLQRLRDANENAMRYDWRGPFFEIDPFDPIVHVAAAALSLDNREMRNAFRLPVLAVVSRRFVTLDARCRLLAELERHRESELDIERRELLRLLGSVIERPGTPIFLASAVVERLMEEVTQAVLKRQKIEESESEREHPLLQGLLEETGRADDLDIDGVARRLSAYGEDAVPFLERTLFPADRGTGIDASPRSQATIKALGSIPCLRSVDVLVTALIADDEERLLSELTQALRALGADAAAALGDMLDLPVLIARRRLRFLEALSGDPSTGMVSHLLREFEEQRQQEAFPAERFGRLVDLAVATGDRVFVPFFIRTLRRKALSAERRDILRSRLQRSPWWEEIVVALRRLKEGKTVFVRAKEGAPESQTARRPTGKKVGKKSKKRGGRKSATSEQDDAALLMEAYHEQLGWWRPIDLPKRRPDAMEKLDELGKRDYRTYCIAQGGDPRRPDLLSQFEDFWLLTPHKELEGRPPWVVQTESVAESMLPRNRKAFLEQQAHTLYECACDVLESGERDRAILRLDCALAVMPEHALARRLRDRIEGREPEHAASKIILPGQ